MIQIESSQLKAIGYNEERQELKVEFKYWNAFYIYSWVPKDEYEALMGAGSVGKYFSANIKNSYKYERI